MAEDYEVGYGKPPQHTRFKKGRSGHPEGRPSGSTNITSELEGLLAAKTTIKVNGAVQKVRTARAICLALIQKALGGDVRASRRSWTLSARQWPTSSKLRRARPPPTSTSYDVLWIALVSRRLPRPFLRQLKTPRRKTSHEHREIYTC
jgi:hypothetical protein